MLLGIVEFDYSIEAISPAMSYHYSKAYKPQKGFNKNPGGVAKALLINPD